MTDKIKVMVGVLAGDHSVHASFPLMAFELPVVASRPDHPFIYSFRVEAGTRPQALARNYLCGTFLAGPGDILVMIDNDMIVNSGALVSLLSMDEWDIAGPLMFMWWPLDLAQQPARMPQCYAVAGMFDPSGPNKIRPMAPAPDASEAHVDWVGSGCIAIKRKVLEDQRMLLARGYDPPALWRQVYEPNMVRTSGLDIDFCRRAKRAGYKVKVKWGAEIGHYKTVDLNQIELYRQLSFQTGLDLGAKHALQMEQEKSGPGPGDGGVAGLAQPGNGAMAGMGMDRPGRATETEAERIVAEHAAARGPGIP